MKGLSDPYAGVITQPDLGPSGISPVVKSKLRLDKHQEALGVALSLEGVRSVFAQPIQVQITALDPP